MISKISTSLKLFALLVFSLVLSACGGNDATSQELRAYEGGEFVISVNPEWKVINSSDFYSEIPKETVVAFTTPEAYNGFFINVNVVKEDLQQAVSSIDYGRANINLSAQNLTDYKKIQEVQVNVSGSPALLHIFEARLNPSEKLIRFVQLYATRGQFGYIVSGGVLTDTPQELRDLVGASVTSFQLR